MPTLLKIVLDAEDVKRGLGDVVAQAGAAKASLENVKGVDADITVTSNAPEAAEAAQAALEGVTAPEVSVNVTSNAPEAVGEASQALEAVTGKEVPLKVVSDTVAIARLEAAIAELEAKEIVTQVKVVDDDIALLQAKLDAIRGKDVTLTTEADTAEAEKLRAVIAQLKDKRVKIQTEVHSRELDRLRGKLADGAPATTFKEKIAGSLKSIRAELNSTNGGAKKLVRSLVAGGGAIGIILAGAASLYKIAAAYMQSLKEETIYLLDILQGNAQALERIGAEIQEKNDAQKNALSTLRDLNQAESLSNQQKLEAAKAVGVLEKAYAGLGAKIDAATDKLKNFDEIQVKALTHGYKAQIQNIEAQMRAQRKIIDETNSQHARKKDPGAENRAKWKEGVGFGTAEESGKRNAEATDKWIALSKQLDALKKNDPVAAYRQKRVAENDDFGKNYSERQKQFAQRKSDDDFNDLKDVGAKIDNRKTAIANERKSKERTDAETELKSAQADYDKAKKEDDKDGRLSAETRIANAKSAILQSDEKIYNWERQIAGLKKDQAEAQKKLLGQAMFELEYNKLIVAGEFRKAEALKLEKELKDQNLALTDAEKEKLLELGDAQNKLSTEKQISDAKDEVRLQQLLLDGKWEEYEVEKLKNEAKRQRKTLTEEEIKQLREQTEAKRKLETMKELDESRDELEIQKLILMGEYAKADALREQLEQKKKGRDYTESELEALRAQAAERKRLALGQNLQDQAYSARYAAMEKAGLGREAATEKALRDAEKNKGGELTDEERELTKRLADLNYTMANPGRTALDSIGGAEIKTNSLTARGGFASGGVAPDKDRVNRAIESYNKQQVRIQEESLKLLQDVKKAVAG